uniref:BPTI/Kunitz inhibitor domain-containing protein n=1 Tax=Heterorhabditis bacteriophora TaxID=37862 RepID=A0A1I7X3M9_HETBA
MKRCIALLAAAALVLATTAVNPCKRQPFRGRCPSKNGETPKRSQFVLRYYMRNGECVSYPYGHCSSDDGEPQLHRYKEECEDACINPPPANLGFPKAFIDQTYGTVGPLPNLNELTEAAAEMVETTSITTTEGKTTQQITSESTKFTTSDLPTTITDLSTQQHSASTTESSTTEVIVTQASTIKPSTTEASTTEASITEIFTKNFSTTEALSTEVFTTAIIAETTTDVPTVKVSTTEVFHDQEAITIPIKKGSKQATSTQQIPASPVTAHSTITDNDSSSALNIPETTITLQESTEEIIIQTTTPTTRTECQRQRAAATASTIKGGFVPICTPQGAFEMMQCEPDARQCFCVDHNGITIANSRTKNGQKPDCAKIQSAISPKIEECIGEASRGPCVSTFNRWFYDENEQICKQFIYSGCGGNGNNYETEKACTHHSLFSKIDHIAKSIGFRSGKFDGQMSSSQKSGNCCRHSPTVVLVL